MPYIEIIYNNSKKTFAINSIDTSIGRSEQCDITIKEDKGVSRFHCAIQQQTSDSFVLLEQDTKNGTFLNGKQLFKEIAELKNNDTIKIGNGTKIIFHEEKLTQELFQDDNQDLII